MLEGKYLQSAIRLILTKHCHLPLRCTSLLAQDLDFLYILTSRSTGSRLLVYLDGLTCLYILPVRLPCYPSITPSAQVGRVTLGNLTTQVTSTPPPHTPETPLNPAQVCCSPNMENHTTPIRRNPAGRVFRMEMRGQSWRILRRKDVPSWGSARLQSSSGSKCSELTIETNLSRSEPVCPSGD